MTSSDQPRHDAAPPEAERHIRLGNVFNLRDLGGYTSVHGGTVAWGRLFRADGLSRLDEADTDLLAPMGFRTVVDLRTPGERENWGVAPTERMGATMVHLPLISVLWDRTVADDDHDTVEYLIARYLEMTEEGADVLASVVRLAIDDGHTPLVFHCSAGKDRTGVTAALLLGLLGVDDATVAADYALTAPAMEALVEWVRRNAPEDAVDTMADQPPTFLACPPEAMRGFLDELRARHGSIVGYADHIGLGADEIAALRTRYLVP